MWNVPFAIDSEDKAALAEPEAVPVLRAVLSGALVAAAYPQPGWWATSLFGYVPLIGWLLQGQRQWKTAAKAGWIAGAVQHAWVYAFLGHTMREMSGFPWWGSLAVIALHAAVMSLHQAAWLALCARLAPRSRWGQVFGWGLLLAAVEFSLPWLFPWYLASALFRQPLWLQPADWLGVPLVSALQVGLSVLLAQAIAARSWRQLGWVLVWLGAWGGYGVVRMAAVDSVLVGDTAAAHKTLRVGVVQHNPTIAEKRSRNGSERMAMLDRAEALSRQTKGPLDLLVWAEGALPYAWQPDPPGETNAPAPGQNHAGVAERVRKLVQELQVPLLTGTLRYTDWARKEQMRNAALLFLPNQPQPWTYDKHILLAFGEYLPLSGWIPALRGAIPGISDFAAGEGSGLVDVAGARLLVNICYEALFPAFLRDAGAEHADILVNLTNDVWFGPQPAPDLHLMVQQARAIELRRPLLRATTTGVTALVDANGRLLQETKVGVQAVLQASIPLRRLASPYLWWGDWPMWILSVSVVGLAVLRRRVDSAPVAAHNHGP